MSAETIDLVAQRVGEHVREHRLPMIKVGLHGGEPLLAGPEIIEHAVTSVRAAVPDRTRVDFTVQTNGVLLNDRFLRLFENLGVVVGVSVDGGRVANDRHRLFPNGRSSFAAVASALRLLAEHPSVYGGLLCTIDVRNDPVGVYEDLLAFSPPQLDLLLPHGNWAAPPPERSLDTQPSHYAEWLIAVFDRWFDAPVRETKIRFFESIIGLLFGLPSESESVGLSPIDLVTVETDGTWEQGDALKTVADGAAATGLTVRDHSLDEALRNPGIIARQRGLAALGPECRQCPIVGVCGGGLYAHRYSDHAGFASPSVYCGDLGALIWHIRGRLTAGLATLPSSRFVESG
jgi:uncharacterized protein